MHSSPEKVHFWGTSEGLVELGRKGWEKEVEGWVRGKGGVGKGQRRGGKASR